MAIKCLMIEAKDKKRFFTLIKNKQNMFEYCRTFDAKMTVVKAELKKEQILDLPKLVTALCDQSHTSKKVEFEVVKKVPIT